MFACKAQCKRFVAECRGANLVGAVRVSLAGHILEDIRRPLLEFLHKRLPILAKDLCQEFGGTVAAQRPALRRAVLVEFGDGLELAVLSLAEERHQ
jgi:hypothetical protein